MNKTLLRNFSKSSSPKYSLQPQFGFQNENQLFKSERELEKWLRGIAGEELLQPRNEALFRILQANKNL